MPFIICDFDKVKIWFLIIGICLVSGCKKTIYKPTGTNVTNGISDPNLPVLYYWESTSIGSNDITCLKTSNGYLFYARNWSNGTALNRLNNSNNLITIFTSSGFSRISDLETFGNRLYVSGKISNGTSSGNVAYVEESNTNIVILPDPYYLSYYVHNMHKIEDYLYFSGTFSSNSFFTTSKIDKMNSSFETEGFSSSGLTYNGFVCGKSDLYLYSSWNNPISEVPYHSLISKFNGTSWESFDTHLGTDEKKVIDVCEYNDTLYISSCHFFQFGNSFYSSDYKGHSVSGSNIIPLVGIEIAYEGVLHFKEVNGHLFAYGKHLLKNGKVSNIYRRVNGHWVIDRIMPYEVFDLEYFNGYYYAATDHGLFKAAF